MESVAVPTYHRSDLSWLAQRSYPLPATNMQNPYRSPLNSAVANSASGVRSAPSILVRVAKISFWLGVFMFVFRSIATFVPGAECGWFVITAIFTAIGVLVPKRRYRVAAAILCVVSCSPAHDGHYRGLRYRSQLSPISLAQNVGNFPNSATI
jgi:hypothetical protein